MQNPSHSIYGELEITCYLYTKKGEIIHCIIKNGLHVYLRGIHNMVSNYSNKLHEILPTFRSPIVLNHTRDLTPLALSVQHHHLSL